MGESMADRLEELRARDEEMGARQLAAALAEAGALMAQLVDRAAAAARPVGVEAMGILGEARRHRTEYLEGLYRVVYTCAWPEVLAGLAGDEATLPLRDARRVAMAVHQMRHAGVFPIEVTEAERRARVYAADVRMLEVLEEVARYLGQRVEGRLFEGTERERALHERVIQAAGAARGAMATAVAGSKKEGE